MISARVEQTSVSVQSLAVTAMRVLSLQAELQYRLLQKHNFVEVRMWRRLWMQYAFPREPFSYSFVETSSC